MGRRKYTIQLSHTIPILLDYPRTRDVLFFSFLSIPSITQTLTHYSITLLIIHYLFALSSHSVSTLTSLHNQTKAPNVKKKKIFSILPTGQPRLNLPRCVRTRQDCVFFFFFFFFFFCFWFFGPRNLRLLLGEVSCTY